MKPVVLLTKAARRGIERAPDHVGEKLFVWVGLVEAHGLLEVRKIPGFHDEPLKGERRGQRSVRLNRSWRAIYVETEDGSTRLVEVQEVHKHEY